MCFSFSFEIEQSVKKKKKICNRSFFKNTKIILKQASGLLEVRFWRDALASRGQTVSRK